jgi:hypothetical protein
VEIGVCCCDGEVVDGLDLQLAQKASSSLALSPSRKSSTSLPTASAPDRRACTALALLLSVIRGLSIARKSSIFAVMYAS